jgi:hypothetical protein
VTVLLVTDFLRYHHSIVVEFSETRKCIELEISSEKINTE